LAGLDWKAHPHSANEIMRMAHFFETRKPENVDLFLGRRTEKNAHFIEAFVDAMGGRAKPVLSGSDAHKLSNYGVFPGGRITWLKADPTWPGLMSVVCEPVERGYIGEKPPLLSRIASNSTKYIRSVEIRKRPDSDLGETWFDSSVPMNHGLVAVIGNKGSGKSALTDIIGLVANSSRENWFPFLKEDQFRQAGVNKARHFTAALTWEDNTRVDKGLDSHIDPDLGEMACYIPQNFFEVICNELARPGEGGFDRELRSVIFSHVGQADRLQRGSLEELVSFRTSEIEQGIAKARLELSRLNQEIVSLEGSLTPAHRKSLEDQLGKKEAELAGLEGKKPRTVRKPRAASGTHKGLSTRMRDLKTQKKGLEEKVAAAQDRYERVALSHSKVTKVLERLRQFRKEIDDLVKQYGQDLKDVGLELAGLVVLTVKDKPILDTKERLAKERRQLESDLDPENKHSLVGQIAALDRRLKELELRLDEPARKHEKYQQELAEWNQKRGEIKGTGTTVGTLRYLQGKLQALDGVPAALEAMYRERYELAARIHDEIVRIADIYRELYAPVQRFIEAHPLASSKFNLMFHVSIVNRDFRERFFELVSHGVTGSFYGVDEARELLRSTLAKYDFGVKESALGFIQETSHLLVTDIRTGDPVEAASQLRKGKAMPALHDLVFGLEYLAPRYVLRMGDKELHELSPGEKGTLLLLFYLLIDRSDTPLIIDQPEHNLDNETIYDLLVPAIREAKQRRQIVVVTHNANIAVVCDADQVICASMDKAHGHKVVYETGAIEDPKINKRIVEVLEGTMPAFDNRDSKYTLVAAARKRIFAA
jgi:ABC-type lipoprotein export system ATPase subunit/prefoldin subunit 5